MDGGNHPRHRFPRERGDRPVALGRHPVALGHSVAARGCCWMARGRSVAARGCWTARLRRCQRSHLMGGRVRLVGGRGRRAALPGHEVGEDIGGAHRRDLEPSVPKPGKEAGGLAQIDLGREGRASPRREEVAAEAREEDGVWVGRVRPGEIPASGDGPLRVQFPPLSPARRRSRRTVGISSSSPSSLRPRRYWPDLEAPLSVRRVHSSPER